MSTLLRWSQARLLSTIAIGYLLFADIASWSFTDGATCIVNPARYGSYYAETGKCPTLDVAFIKILATIFDALRDPNWVIAIATVVTAAFTVVLGTFTISLARSTRTAATAAQKALTELERPYLFIVDYNWLLTERAKSTDHQCGFVYSVVNGGRLPAFITAVRLGIRFGNSIPPTTDEPPIHNLLTAPMIVGGGEREIIQSVVEENGDDASEQVRDPPIEYEIKGGLAYIPSIAFKSRRAIAKIEIEYDGPTTTGHMTTACWEWHPVKYAFTQFGGKEHNQRT